MATIRPHPDMEGTGFTWVLEHLLTYPGTYEIPLRTMYTLNCSTQNPPKSQPPSPNLPGNAFTKQQAAAQEEQTKLATQTAAAQLKATLVQHITQLPSQPASLPPSFITSFVLRCFPPEIEHVDFPQTLTALDYLKDLEVRRRREVVAALDKLGISRDDLALRETMSKKFPGVIRWIEDIEDKERKVEALYTQVYLGVRRWAMINELSLTPFNRANCIAMLNTLYPPVTVHPSHFVQPTVQLTAQVLSTQRQGFFRYINGVERAGNDILSKLMAENKREGELTGWPGVRENLDDYLRMANSIIDESYEVTGSPTTTEFEKKADEDARRKVDSGISFGSSNSSNRNSAQSDKSHATRRSTSSSMSTHSRKTSKEKALAADDDVTLTSRTPGSTLERIARELRRMKSSKNVREQPGSRKASVTSETADVPMVETAPEATPVSRARGLSFKRSLRNMRSRSNLRSEDGSRPSSRNDDYNQGDIPAFDAEEMRRRRLIWEAQQAKTR